MLRTVFSSRVLPRSDCQFPKSLRSSSLVISCNKQSDSASRQNEKENVLTLCNHKLQNTANINNDRDLIKRLTLCKGCNAVTGKHVSHSPQWKSINSLLPTCDGALGTLPHNKPLDSLWFYKGVSSLSYSDTNWIILRSLHTTPRTWKEESKAEQTVKALKDEVEKQKGEKLDKKPSASSASIKADAATEGAAREKVPKLDENARVDTAAALAPKEEKSAATTAEKSTAVATPKKSIWQKVVAEVKHYYHGFRLLFIDMRVAARLLWQVVNGNALTRRERRQLVRTTADMFRLVPFLVFVVIPFMEFLLPVAIKLFPNMLPSTFAEKTKEQEKLRKKLKSKLEMAKFLQDTIEETALTRKGAKGENVQQFATFMDNIRTSGEITSNVEILKYSKLFEDEITLDNLQYGQLRALCRLLDLQPVGTSNFLRFQLRMKVRQLETDDKMIQKEGLDNMATWEMQEACRARGMRSLGVPKARLQAQLEQWLDLHLNEQIPTSLLLLSRTLYLPDQLSTEEQLKATISALPETTADEAKVKISEVTGDRVDNRAKLEVITHEEEALKKEKEEGEKEKKEEAAKVKAKEEMEVAQSVDEPVLQPSIVDLAPEMKPMTGEVLEDKATVISINKAEEVIPDTPVVEEEQAISPEELDSMEAALDQAAEDHIQMRPEEVDIEELKEDVEEYQEAIEDLKEVVLASGGQEQDMTETKAAQRLSKKVNKMVSQIDSISNQINTKKEAILEDIEVREVRMKRNSELREDQDQREEMLAAIKEKKERLLDMNELILGMRRLQKVPDDTRLQRIVQVLDEDNDGKIDVTDALKVIHLMGQENLKINSQQMSEIMDLLNKENVLEQQEKEERKRQKLEKELGDNSVTGVQMASELRDPSEISPASSKKDSNDK